MSVLMRRARSESTVNNCTGQRHGTLTRDPHKGRGPATGRATRPCETPCEVGVAHLTTTPRNSTSSPHSNTTPHDTTNKTNRCKTGETLTTKIPPTQAASRGSTEKDVTFSRHNR